jgi:hypothetical protein
MMMLALTLVALLNPISAPTRSIEVDVRAKFVELAAKKDREGCKALWKANKSAVLPVIDTDLEGSMKLREKAKDAPDTPEKVREMQLRALWGAGVAHEAGFPLILDYASSFVGWDEAQRKRFREGQAAFGRANKAMKEKDAKAALDAGTECLQRAAALGDWWGTAMGWSAIATSQKSLGELERALEAASNANAIYVGIGLEGDEYGTLGMMAELCELIGRPARGKSCADRGIELAQKLGDADGEKRLTQLRDRFTLRLMAGLENVAPAK